MNKHTPGPWASSRDAVPAGHTQTTVYAESGGERVATVFREEANARLIAKSPEMLEELLIAHKFYASITEEDGVKLYEAADNNRRMVEILLAELDA